MDSLTDYICLASTLPKSPALWLSFRCITLMTDDVYANAVPYTSPDFSSALLPQPLLKLWLHHQYAMVKFFL
jgi:hypothetical protein